MQRRGWVVCCQVAVCRGRILHLLLDGYWAWLSVVLAVAVCVCCGAGMLVAAKDGPGCITFVLVWLQHLTDT